MSVGRTWQGPWVQDHVSTEGKARTQLTGCLWHSWYWSLLTAIVYFLPERTQNCGLYWLILAVLTQIYALVGVLLLGRNNAVVYFNWHISDMPFDKENGKEIGGNFSWEGKINMHCLLRQVKYTNLISSWWPSWPTAPPCHPWTTDQPHLY